MMPIETTIRQLRQARGLTQEQVARALGVSAPAVSKWETGASLPEITLLPALARLLGTDLNELLSFQKEMSREEVAAFLNQLAETAAAEGVPAAVAQARAQHRQFLRSGLLALNLALLLEGLELTAASPLEEADAAWIAALYQQAADCDDREVAAQAVAMLFGKAMEQGELDRARALLDRLPPPASYDKKQMEARLALAEQDRAAGGALLERQLLEQVSAVQSTLLSLMELAAEEGRWEDLDTLADQSCALGKGFDLAEYGLWSIRLEQAVLGRKHQEGLEALAGLLACLEESWPEKTSPFRRYLEGKKMDLSLLAPGIRRELADPSDHRLDFLREDPRFQALLREEEGPCATQP